MEIEKYFKIGKEIEIFNSEEELIEKIRFYLNNDSARKKIAKAGYNRVMKDYTLTSQLDKAAKLIKSKVA